MSQSHLLCPDLASPHTSPLPPVTSSGLSTQSSSAPRALWMCQFGQGEDSLLGKNSWVPWPPDLMVLFFAAIWCVSELDDLGHEALEGRHFKLFPLSKIGSTGQSLCPREGEEEHTCCAMIENCVMSVHDGCRGQTRLFLEGCSRSQCRDTDCGTWLRNWRIHCKNKRPWGSAVNWVSSGHCRTTAAKVAKATNIPAWMEGDLAEMLWQLLAVVGGRVRLLGLTQCAPLSLHVCLHRIGPGLCMGNICKDLEPYYIYVIFFSCTR